MAEKSSQKKVLQRILVLGSGLAFLSSSIVFIVNSLFSGNTTSNPQTNNPTGTTTSVQQQLLAQAQGYEKVLAREPDNVLALNALMKIRISLGDLQGAIAPTKKLIKLYPQETRFQEILTAIEKAIAEQKKQPSPQPTKTP
jgi:tetratricopeptide (TPR) repeat protein